MNAGSYNSYSHQPVQSHAQSPATAFGNVGPVIAHYGYQAGPDRQQGFQQSSAAGYGQQQYSQFGGYQAQPQGGYGMSQVQSYTTSEHPVYEATNAYQQAGPVISRVGYQANSQGYSQNSNNFR
ncbi:hypothetical protein D3C78_1390940 [compost metagenome]